MLRKYRVTSSQRPGFHRGIGHYYRPPRRYRLSRKNRGEIASDARRHGSSKSFILFAHRSVRGEQPVGRANIFVRICYLRWRSRVPVRRARARVFEFERRYRWISRAGDGGLVRKYRVTCAQRSEISSGNRWLLAACGATANETALYTRSSYLRATYSPRYIYAAAHPRILADSLCFELSQL